MTAALAGIGAAVACLAVILWQMLAARSRAKAEAAKWIPLPTVTLTSSYQLAPGAAMPSDLVSAVDWAVVLLRLHGPWASDALHDALCGVRILIQSTESWSAQEMASVGGQTQLEAHMVAVGPSLGALCHELAHLAQFRIDGTVDYQHATWGTNGIWAADAAYRKQLGGTNG